MMNRNNLPSLLLLDLIVMALAVGLFVFRYQSLKSASSEIPYLESPTAAPNVTIPKLTVIPAVSSAAAPPADGAAAEAATQPPQEVRHIGFQYRNSKAKRVELIGDFNEWVPQPMNLGLDYKWTATLTLAPGEYSYNYIVDGKPIRDPYNPKVCNAGRGYPSSFLKVKFLHEETKAQ